MKNRFRKKYLLIRKEIKNKVKKDEIIYQRVINNDRVKKADLILIYVSFNNEVDTRKIIKYLLKDKKVAVPKIENNMMNFYIINSFTDLKEGYFKVLEPINGMLVTNFDNTVSITPGICFSQDGYRLGYGKGYYDKFYAKHMDIYKIGLCYHELLLDNIPFNEYDIKVDEVIID